MKLKHILLTGLGILTINGVVAQANILNAKIPEEIGMKTEEQLLLDNDEPLEYGYVDDRDRLYSKMTWERVVLDERVNFPLYYPVDTNNIGPDRRSLFHVLWSAVKSGDIPRAYGDSYFSQERTYEELLQSMRKVDTLDIGFDQFNADGFVDPEYIIERNIEAYDIKAFLLKGLWYFDKRQGEMKYRLLAIAPAAPDVNFIDGDDYYGEDSIGTSGDVGGDNPNQEPIPLFWVFYPEARGLLHEAKAYNNKNSAMPISFDHILNSRRFNGYMYKEENVYGDREVKDYIKDNALMQLLESQRIKDKIRNFEQDMWNY
ncbi:MAG: gliding motility protein GldN [Winogradskyella sp.]|uniref:type IX secretion system ring protein PorN/GldN n=1 Tax=Winogradskyella sp. TaxID=1883156 RepID=UPI000F3B8570|nr:gliding motility protein GldN [Winogradskyella sp.]RNC85069.1 MAG: gliding motility protein GldN [Winogradskyella sp.]